jgi:membrane-associated phospholipid phosphatase
VRAASLARGAALAGAAAVTGWVALGTAAGRDADARAFAAVNRGHGPGADRAFAAVTELGSLYAVGAAAAVLAAAGRPRTAARAALAAGAAWTIGLGAKRIVERPRPYVADPTGTRSLISPPMGTSWPSSHPAVLTSFTAVAARDLGIGRAGRAALWALGGAVAASRVYLGVHYPGDVVGGLLLGRAVAAAWPAGTPEWRR